MSDAFLADSVNTTSGSQYIVYVVVQQLSTAAVFSEFYDQLASLERRA